MNEKVLLVDDDAAVLTAVSRVLGDRFNTLTANSADAAREILVTHPDVAIVLTDYDLPGESGLELLGEMQRKFPLAVRGVISGKIDLQLMEKALASGLIHRMIRKPWDNNYLKLQMLESLAIHATLVEKQKLSELSFTDAVTMLKNHRFFVDQLAIELERVDRHERILSMMMIDVDHFKAFNDRFGHPAGDRLLRAIAARLQDQVRTIDTVARYGGEEFAIILPDTPLDQAIKVAERVRSAFENQAFDEEGRKTFVTISCGVACAPRHGNTVTTLVKTADEALYRAKRQGRNQSVGA